MLVVSWILVYFQCPVNYFQNKNNHIIIIDIGPFNCYEFALTSSPYVGEEPQAINLLEPPSSLAKIIDESEHPTLFILKPVKKKFHKFHGKLKWNLNLN